MTTCTYRLSNIMPNMSMTAIFRNTAYRILAIMHDRGVMYVEGPMSTFLTRNMKRYGIRTMMATYIDGYQYERERSRVVIIFMQSTMGWVWMNATLIHDIVKMFIEELSKRVYVPDGYEVRYVYKAESAVIHVELETIEHARIACDLNDPIFDAYMYNMLYLYSTWRSKTDKLMDPNADTYTHVVDDDMPKLLDE